MFFSSVKLVNTFKNKNFNNHGMKQRNDISRVRPNVITKQMYSYNILMVSQNTVLQNLDHMNT